MGIISVYAHREGEALRGGEMGELSICRIGEMGKI